MNVETLLVAGLWLVLGVILGGARPAAYIVAAVAFIAVMLAATSPMLMLAAAMAFARSPTGLDAASNSWVFGAVVGTVIGGPGGLLAWGAGAATAVSPPPAPPPQAADLPPLRFRRTGRVEPSMQAGPPALSPERMAEIEAEERFRAEVRARLAAQRGEGEEA